MPDSALAHNGVHWSLFDLILAIRAWLRQLRFHRGVLNVVPVANASGFTVRRGASGAIPSSFSDEDLVMFHVLTHPRFDCEMSTIQLRGLLRNRMYRHSLGNASVMIHRAIQTLVAVGCVKLIDERSRTRRGPSVIVCAKKPWSEIQGNPDVLAFLSRIGVDSHNFP